MEKMVEVVQENMSAAQDHQKKWYDKKARARQFFPGEQVLVLLPTSTQKLLAQWHGPYTVVERKGRVNYKVDMHNKKKRYRTLHINMLRKWHAPSTVCFAGEDREVDMEDDIPVWKEESSGTYALGQACRQMALHLALEIPLAGYMGREKTTRRLMQRFYWYKTWRTVNGVSCSKCWRTTQMS